MGFLENLISNSLEAISYFLFLGAFAVYYYTYSRETRYKVLLVYYLISFPILLLILYLSINTYLYNFLYLFSSLCLGGYFYSFFKSKIKRGIAITFCATTILYYIVKSIMLNEQLFDSVGYVISSFGIIVMIFMCLHQIMTHVSEESLSLNFDFWFISSQLIYHLGAFGIFLTFNWLTQKILPSEYYVKENRIMMSNLWGVHNVLLFLGSLLTWSGLLWIAYRRRSTSS